MLKNTMIDYGVAKLIGSYSDAAVVEPNTRWLYTSGTPGLDLNGNLPSTIEGQSEVLWTTLIEVLKRADMTLDDLVKVSTTLINSAHVAPYSAIRKKFLGERKPAFMLTVATQLIKPEFLVEVEIIAASPAN